mmetsp:Transcript_2921/g.7041  ORF Transcript_2921/g.7041 Transcript_2921/m.7041 type:complete len:213 (-) Transcript_2921:874-1512(-)
MANELWISVINKPFQVLRESALCVHDHVLDVVDHAALTALSGPRSPNQAIQQDRKQGGCIHAETLHDVGMALEQNVHTEVVAIAVRADGQEVQEDGSGRLQAPGLDGPEDGRDGLRAHLHIQHPKGSLATRGARDSTSELSVGIGIDGLHDHSGALVDDARQDARNKVQAPSEGLLGSVVVSQGADDLHTGSDKGPKEVCGDSITDVAEAER